MPDLIFPVRRRDHFMIPDAMFRTEARPTHGGLDLTPVVQSKPTPFFAPEPGRIVIADRTLSAGDTSGYDVMLLGDWTGYRWWDGHLSKVTVELGEWVEQGRILGWSGTTGSSLTGKASSTGVHHHIEVHFPSINTEIDPWPIICDLADVDGSRMPLAGSRVKASVMYPAYVEKAINVLLEEIDMSFTPEERAEALALLRSIRHEQVEEDGIAQSTQKHAAAARAASEEVRDALIGVPAGGRYTALQHFRESLNGIRKHLGI